MKEESHEIYEPKFMEWGIINKSNFEDIYQVPIKRWDPLSTITSPRRALITLLLEPITFSTAWRSASSRGIFLVLYRGCVPFPARDRSSFIRITPQSLGSSRAQSGPLLKILSWLVLYVL